MVALATLFISGQPFISSPFLISSFPSDHTFPCINILPVEHYIYSYCTKYIVYTSFGFLVLMVAHQLDCLRRYDWPTYATSSPLLVDLFQLRS